MHPVLTFPLVGAAVSQCSEYGPRAHGDSHQPLSALGFERAQPVPKLQLVKRPWCLVLPRKKPKRIPVHGWGQRRRRQHNCLPHGESHCAYLHLSITYDGTALQVEIGPLLLG